MKREIRFRIWDDDKKEMMPLGVATQRDILGIDENDSYLRSEYPQTVHLMQQTGLKDKYGIDIYEGDVIGYWGNACWAVGWNPKKCCYAATYFEGEKTARGEDISGAVGFSLTQANVAKKAIIGNIYTYEQKD